MNWKVNTVILWRRARMYTFSKNQGAGKMTSIIFHTEDPQKY